MLISRFRGQDKRLALADGLESVARLDHTGPHPPALMAYAPVSRGNPFQSLLYGGLADHNMRSVAAYDINHARQLAQAVQGDVRMLVHLHWLNVVMQSASDTRQARTLMDAFVSELDRIKQAGGSLAWTVHNALPHDSRFPDLDLELRHQVVDRADLVHVMSPRTRELTAPYFTLPTDRTFAVPHPSYLGVYPSWMTRAEARAELGVPDDAVVFVLFGRIAPYKGANELVDAVDELAQSHPGRVHLLLAGQPTRSAESKALMRRVTAHPAVHGAFRKIADVEVQVFLRAADAMVVPYRRSLNSGALNLGLTFDLPVVLPASSGEASDSSALWATVYNDAVAHGLRDALEHVVMSPPGSAARQAAHEAAQRVAPSAVASQFAGVVRAWLDTGDVPSDARS